MPYLAVTVAFTALMWRHRRDGPTMLRHRRVVAIYWAPAAALLSAGWVQASRDTALAALLFAAGTVLASMWVAELIQPSIAYEEAEPCPLTLVPQPRSGGDSNAETSSG